MNKSQEKEGFVGNANFSSNILDTFVVLLLCFNFFVKRNRLDDKSPRYSIPFALKKSVKLQSFSMRCMMAVL